MLQALTTSVALSIAETHHKPLKRQLRESNSAPQSGVFRIPEKLLQFISEKHRCD